VEITKDWLVTSKVNLCPSLSLISWLEFHLNLQEGPQDIATFTFKIVSDMESQLATLGPQATSDLYMPLPAHDLIDRNVARGLE
jgi:hypothetical protein